MHHAFVRCNYSPYSTHWDRVFGTFKPFEAAKGGTSKQESPEELADQTLPPIVSPLDVHLGADRARRLRVGSPKMRLDDDLLVEADSCSARPLSPEATAAGGGTNDEYATDGAVTVHAADGAHPSQKTAAAKSGATAAALAIFSQIFGLTRKLEAEETDERVSLRLPSLEGEFSAQVAERLPLKSLESKFNAQVSERIWAKHRNMGEGFEAKSLIDTEETDVPGEPQVVMRGVAYSIAGCVNVLAFCAIIGLSLSSDTPAW